MLESDAEVRQLLARERRAALARDALKTGPQGRKPDVGETEVHARWWQVPRFRLHVRPARRGSS